MVLRKHELKKGRIKEAAHVVRKTSLTSEGVAKFYNLATKTHYKYKNNIRKKINTLLSKKCDVILQCGESFYYLLDNCYLERAYDMISLSEEFVILPIIDSAELVQGNYTMIKSYRCEDGNLVEDVASLFDSHNFYVFCKRNFMSDSNLILLIDNRKKKLIDELRLGNVLSGREQLLYFVYVVFGQDKVQKFL